MGDLFRAGLHSAWEIQLTAIVLVYVVCLVVGTMMTVFAY